MKHVSGNGLQSVYKMNSRNTTSKSQDFLGKLFTITIVSKNMTSKYVCINLYPETRDRLDATIIGKKTYDQQVDFLIKSYLQSQRKEK